MVSNYFQDCKYSLLKLQPYVYLVSEDALKDIRIDDGNAYVSTISQTPIRLDAYNVTLNESEELNERYKFTHTLTFSVSGYANKDDFQDRYYAIVKDEEGTYWLVNPMFPCRVTYTYNLGYEQNHTDFTIGTASNHPVLRLNTMVDSTPYECKKYYLSGIDSVVLNEKKYTAHDGKYVKYTNSGFKTVEYNNRSALFTEEFDGYRISHTLTFNIPFSQYKSSWHYNLLEFTDNLYSAIVKTTEGKYAFCGFSYGMQPSFTINADDSDNINYIEIRLSDAHDIGDTIDFYDEVIYQPITEKSWAYTLDYGGYECVGAGIARYLLQKEIDAFGNETGNYKAFSGYTSQFPDLNIVGEFSTTENFSNSECTGEECNISTSLPSIITFNAAGNKTYSLRSDTEWSISSSSPALLSVSPSSGHGNTSYVITVHNTITPSESAITNTLTLSYCNTTRDVTVIVTNEQEGCLSQGTEYNISANAQTVTVPTSCCVTSVKEMTAVGVDITLYSNYFTVYVPENNSGRNRSMVLLVLFCDGTSVNVVINQSSVFERWVNESVYCDGYDKYQVQRLYTGSTSSSINGKTDTTRSYLVEADSQDCHVEPIIEWRNKDITLDYICDDCDQAKASWNTINGTSSSVTCDASSKLQRADLGVISDYLFSSIKVGTCVDEIFDSALYNMRMLMTVELPSTITKIGARAFMEDQSLFSCHIPNTVTEIGNSAFYNCVSLQTVTLPSSLTTLGTYAFAQCLNFSNVGTPSGITSIPEGCFMQCQGLSDLYISNNIQSIGLNGFYNCVTLKNVVFQSGSTLTTIGASAFSFSNIESIDIPNSVTTIGESAFAGSSSMSGFSIPTSITTIGQNAFSGCATGSLTVVFPSSITSIGASAFTSLDNVVFDGTTPPTVGSSAFGSVNNIYVPVGYIPVYASAMPEYQNKIHEITS